MKAALSERHDELMIVNHIHQLKHLGHGNVFIAEMLEELGLHCPDGRWDSGAVSRILKRYPMGLEI